MGRKERGNAFHKRLAVLPPGPIVASTPVGCLKVAYETETDAKVARVKFGQRAVYRCRLCQKWHTTKNPNFKLKTT